MTGAPQPRVLQGHRRESFVSMLVAPFAERNQNGEQIRARSGELVLMTQPLARRLVGDALEDSMFDQNVESVC